jgi:DNA polymerase-3 subunit delta
MIFFLYGADSYRSKKKLNEITEHYKEIHKTGMGFIVLNADNEKFSDFKRAVETTSMFAEKKLVILKNSVSSKEFAEKFLSWKGGDFLKNTADVICIFHEEAVDKKSEMFAWLIKNSQSQEFDILKGAQLQKWVQRFFTEAGIKAEKSALSRILSHTAGNLWSLENEVNKLKAYVTQTNGSRREISNSDLDIFFRPAAETNVFFLIDAFTEGNTPKAIRFLKGRLAAGDNEIYLFSMIYNQFRNVIQAQDFLEKGENNIFKNANLMGIHPYVAKKSAAQARRFDKDKIKKAVSRLAAADIGMKTGIVEPKHALESLILES